MNRITANILNVAFLLDAIIAIGFGLYSWFYPHQTFGTMLSIPANNAPAFVAILSSLSLFYVVIGVMCLVGFKASFPANVWIGLVMIGRHVLEGLMKITDIGKEWLIGNPYPDIIIHAVFVLVYALAVYVTYKNSRA